MRGHLISFLSTRRNIQRLPKIPPHQSSLITLVELTLPPTEVLSEDAESTMDLEVDKVPYLKMALDGLEEQMADFLATASLPVIAEVMASHHLPMDHRNGVYLVLTTPEVFVQDFYRPAQPNAQASHEPAELSSNPLENAWYIEDDSTRGCTGRVVALATPQVRSNDTGRKYNLSRKGGRRFLVQSVWSPVLMVQSRGQQMGGRN
ncbi:hypothetical protein Taro_044510 [Colocasia esculenta]|uniref:Uncharacterized protein n=1 Tax=Colocasia esculenta TaxID=4460 RepID=A0A843WNV8_COLES|nr:hypothetical protein [Colocasia esculenta]